MNHRDTAEEKGQFPIKNKTKTQIKVLISNLNTLFLLTRLILLQLLFFSFGPSSICFYHLIFWFQLMLHSPMTLKITILVIYVYFFRFFSNMCIILMVPSHRTTGKIRKITNVFGYGAVLSISNRIFVNRIN